MKAHIQIVGWNHRQFLDACLASCYKQTLQVPVLYIDNASSDGSAAYVAEKYPWVKTISNSENVGYAGGHNRGISEIKDSEVVILLNPDVILENSFTEEILKPFSDKVGAVVPLLLRGKECGDEGTFKTVVDSYGIRLKKNLNAENKYEGQYLSNEIHSEQLWGFSGAAVALSRTMISDLTKEGPLFDEDLHSYREDVDLSWRMRNNNWKVMGNPKARAWHIRAARKGERKSAHVRGLSWRNYFLVIIKDVPLKTVITYMPFVIVESFLRVVQLVVSPSIWRAFPTLLRLVPTFIKKRKAGL